MASSLPAIASTYSTSISAMNGVIARSKLGCISTNINGVTFLPAGKLMRSSVGLSSLYQRRTNGLVVRADNEQNSMAQTAWSVHEEEFLKSGQTLISEMVKSRSLSVRTPWDRTENETELHMTFDIPVPCEDVKVSLMGERIMVIEGTRKDPGSASSYETHVLMPRNYNSHEIKVTFDHHGQLKITIPKAGIEIHDLHTKLLAEFRERVENIAIPIPITVYESKVVSNVETIHETISVVCDIIR